MTSVGKDTLGTRDTFDVGGKTYSYYSLAKAGAKLGDVSRLPFSMKVLLENLLRFEDGDTVTTDDVQALVDWQQTRTSEREIQYRPARVLMQDFTGVPAVVDLAAMRDAMAKLGGDPQKINPLVPVHLVIDHSVMVDAFGTPQAFEENVALEYQRNSERYEFLKWGQSAFNNFEVVPPGTGICHQVNLEYIARGVWSSKGPDGSEIAYPDTLVGTDSHTTMVNGLGVLGWGVGGIEAEAAMLGQPVSMIIPEVVGFRLTGELKEGITATDLVLTVTQMLRAKGVVGRFVEFFGPGVGTLSLADRATIGNMAPEYGATCGFFPIDRKTIDYMRLSGRSDEQIALVEAYCKAQGLWLDPDAADPVFTEMLALDMSTVEPSLAGPKRPQDKVLLSNLHKEFAEALEGEYACKTPDKRCAVEGQAHDLGHGDVVIAAITSCTNTSNPAVLVAAGLVARKAREKGLKSQPWVKTSLAPGSQVVTDYLEKSGLQDDLNALGFELVGYGCTTCIGNSGPLPEPISKAINANDLVAASVLSGNRNFEGRVSPDVRANYLASPPLVVAYAVKGTVRGDMVNDPIGKGKDGEDVYLRDIWPSNGEVRAMIDSYVNGDMFRARYADVYKGDSRWQAIRVTGGDTYGWPAGSTYIANPPYFEGMTMTPAPTSDIVSARPLAILGDSITTDHISPAGSIKLDSPAGKYLTEHQVSRADFNSYGARRGNHEVMMRGTFANIRIKNKMVPGIEGGITRYVPTGEAMPIYDAAMKYKAEGTPLVIIAGKEYGTGSSRDWAAKGTNLLGVRAVVAESFERIHRSNLVGMGVIPLQFVEAPPELDGSETFTITGVADLRPRQEIAVKVTRADGTSFSFPARVRIDTAKELEYFTNGGILHYVLRSLAA
ncbi:aconitate hydratase AcnA [Sphingosinicella ginsenosidimutans]|uniref:Aconitate hydratase n=1 Tax=Allosphingosinicella ginsenosidimutans TaxID=1176539 RepID=A0A5C6TRK3_9SPHN|nr:aconitate hydratase AcnA [Sphingosinicella ginsenosidimutans]TXC63004.1 aconitate hydratase AcnA [Sphingosinicella ginsenosidimutans]